mmetsp:Transcript_62787/g.99561  ORF Transcript_62787/g.99561 Transcript_62787/m.99561 type:complete len:230 (+) Transcript_62787:840-1529(+)
MMRKTTTSLIRTLSLSSTTRRARWSSRPRPANGASVIALPRALSTDVVRRRCTLRQPWHIIRQHRTLMIAISKAAHSWSCLHLLKVCVILITKGILAGYAASDTPRRCLSLASSWRTQVLRAHLHIVAKAFHDVGVGDDRQVGCFSLGMHGVHLRACLGNSSKEAALCRICGRLTETQGINSMGTVSHFSHRALHTWTQKGWSRFQSSDSLRSKHRVVIIDANSWHHRW